jgi:hypothetical protein
MSVHRRIEVLSGLKVSCMRVAHRQVTSERRWTAAVLHPGVVELVVQATKAAKR